MYYVKFKYSREIILFGLWEFSLVVEVKYALIGLVKVKRFIFGVRGRINF